MLFVLPIKRVQFMC